MKEDVSTARMLKVATIIFIWVAVVGGITVKYGKKIYILFGDPGMCLFTIAALAILFVLLIRD